MQREITLKDFEKTVNSVDDIEPLILKRENKKDLLVISLEQYQKEMFCEEEEYIWKRKFFQTEKTVCSC